MVVEPLAVLEKPAAKLASPLALVPKPNAADLAPMFASSHSFAKTSPARNASFFGYQRRRTPPPDAARLPVFSVPVTANPSFHWRDPESRYWGWSSEVRLESAL